MHYSPELNNVLSKPIAVFGFGTTGRSVLKWLKHRGVPSSKVSVLDNSWSPEKSSDFDALQYGQAVDLSALDTEAKLSDCIRSFSTLVISPGVFPNHPVRLACRQYGINVINDIQLWAWAIDQTTASIVGITGSNGKSTVTAWLDHVANTLGVHSVAGGNIGLPVLDVLYDIENGKCNPVQLWVLELSSFQLEDCAPLHFKASTILNISEDHLDYHGGIQAYREAKERILKQAEHSILPDGYSATLKQSIASFFGVHSECEWYLKNSQLHYHDQVIVSQSELPLLGNHNALNALVVFALLKILKFDIFSERVVNALCSFKGLPHRVERIAQFNGVDFIEDSKGTNVGSTVAALEGLGTRYTKLILIAGGDGKGQDFSPLVKPMLQFCRCVFLIGRDAPLLAEKLKEAGVKYYFQDSLESAVEMAFGAAVSGEAVVLSPACASWDMFRHYVHRAEVFIESVQRCIKRAENVPTH